MVRYVSLSMGLNMHVSMHMCKMVHLLYLIMHNPVFWQMREVCNTDTHKEPCITFVQQSCSGLNRCKGSQIGVFSSPEDHLLPGPSGVLLQALSQSSIFVTSGAIFTFLLPGAILLPWGHGPGSIRICRPLANSSTPLTRR